MATVDSDSDMYSYAQRGQSPDEYYKVFSSTVKTINANGGRAGLHPAVFKRHFVPMKEKGVEKTGKPLQDLTPAELAVVEDTATEATKEAATGE